MGVLMFLKVSIRGFGFFFIFILVSLYAYSQGNAQHQNTLRLVDEQVTFWDTDLSAEYTIVKREPGGGISTTVATMFRRDRTNQYLILMLEPSQDRGKGYLKQDDNLWLYDPVGKSFTFTSAKERFQNSSIRNSDFNRSNYANDYTVLNAWRERLGRFDCTVFELEAKTNMVSYPRVKLWVSDDFLIRKTEDYSLSGQIMRTTAIPSYQKVGEKWVPVSIVIEDHLKFIQSGSNRIFERTTITIRKPSLVPVPDHVYTKEYLERVNR